MEAVEDIYFIMTEKTRPFNEGENESDETYMNFAFFPESVAR